MADASALGSTLARPLRDAYGRGFGEAVVAAASNLGPIIPPSAAMIVYGIMAGSGVSVGGLFMAGVVPGLIMAAGMMVLVSLIAWRRGLPLTGEPISLRQIAHRARKAFLVFMMPVVVIGGIVGGVFTATEGSAIAVVYAVLVGFFVTRRLRLADLPHCLFAAAVTSAVVGLLIAFASAVTFLFTVELVPMRLAAFLRGMTTDPLLFLLLVMLILVVVGMFIEANAAFIMLVPLFAPPASAYGIDPLHFGFLFVLNIVIGMLTPPVGVLLFVTCGVTGIRMGELLRHVWPFILLQYGVLLLCLLVPQVVTALPRAMGY